MHEWLARNISDSFAYLEESTRSTDIFQELFFNCKSMSFDFLMFFVVTAYIFGLIFSFFVQVCTLKYTYLLLYLVWFIIYVRSITRWDCKILGYFLILIAFIFGKCNLLVVLLSVICVYVINTTLDIPEHFKYTQKLVLLLIFSFLWRWTIGWKIQQKRFVQKPSICLIN